MSSTFISANGSNYEINSFILNICSVFTKKVIDNEIDVKNVTWADSVTNYIFKNNLILASNLYCNTGEESETCVLMDGIGFYPLKRVIDRVRYNVIKMVEDRLELLTKKQFTDAIPKWFTDDCNDPVDHTPATPLVDDILFNTANIKETVTYGFEYNAGSRYNKPGTINPTISYINTDGDKVTHTTEVVMQKAAEEIWKNADAIVEYRKSLPVEVRVIPEVKRRGRKAVMVDPGVDFGGM